VPCSCKRTVWYSLYRACRATPGCTRCNNGEGWSLGSIVVFTPLLTGLVQGTLALQ
jgi:hypothetical protein